MFDKCETIGDLQRALWDLAAMEDNPIYTEIADKISQIMNGIISEIDETRLGKIEKGDYSVSKWISWCISVIAYSMR